MSWMPEEYIPGLVSVIVPTFNRAHMILRALDSVFAQTYRPIELIVVDDGSTDDTQPVLSAWSKTHESAAFNVKLILQSNQGAQVARNRGLSESSGEYIQFLDSDDELLEYKIAAQTELLKRTGADYCYGRTEIVGKDGKVASLQGKPRQDGGPWIAEHAWHTNSPLFLRRVCTAIGPWDISLSGCQEYEYAARVKAAEFLGRFVPEVLDRVRHHGEDSISGQASERYAQTMELAAQRVLALLPRGGAASDIERSRVRDNLIAIALRYARCGNATATRRCLSTAAGLSVPERLNHAKIILAVTRLAPPRAVLEIVRLLANVTGSAQRLHAESPIPNWRP